MAAINRVRKGQDDIYEASGVAAISGGILVVPHTGATNAGVQGIDVAGDGATNVLGVTARDAIPVSAQTTVATDADGFPIVNPDQPNELTAVWKGCVVPVTYASTSTYTSPGVAYGQKLVAAANGHVRPYNFTDPDAAGGLTADTDPRMIVGECRQIGGIGAAGGVGLAYIY